MKFNVIDMLLSFAVGGLLGAAIVASQKPSSIMKYQAAVEYGYRCAKAGSTLPETLNEMKHPRP